MRSTNAETMRIHIIQSSWPTAYTNIQVIIKQCTPYPLTICINSFDLHTSCYIQAIWGPTGNDTGRVLKTYLEHSINPNGCIFKRAVPKHFALPLYNSFIIDDEVMQNFVFIFHLQLDSSPWHFPWVRDGRLRCECDTMHRVFNFFQSLHRCQFHRESFHLWRVSNASIPPSIPFTINRQEVFAINPHCKSTYVEIIQIRA